MESGNQKKLCLNEPNNCYKKGNQAQNIYYLATIVVVTKLILAYSELIVLPNFMNTIFNFIFIFLMLLKLIVSFEFKVRKIYVLFFLFSIMALYTSVKADYYIILLSAMAIIGLKKMNIRNIIKVMFATKVFWLTVHFICFSIMIVFLPQMVKYSVIGGVIRYRILLSQPNTCAMLFLWAIFEYIYLNYEKINFNKFIICTFVFGLILYITKSKTTVIVYIALWLMIWQKKRKVMQKFISLFSKYGYVILSIFFISLTVLYTVVPWARSLNTMLTGRLAGSAKAYELYGFTMFGQYLELGQKIDWDAIYGVTSIWLENSYTMMVINCGIVYAILIAIALRYTANYLTEKDKIFVCAMLIYGISESYIVDVFLCFPLLIVAGAIYNKRKYLLMKNE